MKTKSWQFILIGGIVAISGIGLGFKIDEMLFPQILAVLGIEIVIFESVRKYIFKKSSVKTLGITIIFFSILNFIRHSMFFIVISRIGELFENSPDFIWFLSRESIWLIASSWILFKGINLVKEKEETDFKEYVKSKEFKILTTLIIVLLILEVPLFGIHGDFGGGLHGHGFWDGGTHIQ